MANKKCGMCMLTGKPYSARPLVQPYRDCSPRSAPPWFHLTKWLPPFPRAFTWQIEAGSIKETITEPDNSDDLRPKSLTYRVMLGPALAAVPLWLLKWCWASMSLIELAPLWGERYIIRNQGAQSIPTGHWWVLWVTGKMSRCQDDFKATHGFNLIPSVLGPPVRKGGQQIQNLISSRINTWLKNLVVV